MQDLSVDTVVLVPIRSFDDTKSRLAAVLEPEARRGLSMSMAQRVVGAAGALPVRVVTDDPGVVTWAEIRNIDVLPVAVTGLNESVTAAVDRAAALGFDRAIIAHADLPAADDLGVVNRPGVCIAPDRARDGSNVMCVPTGAGFRFSYGPASFSRHCAEAARLALELTIVDDETLAWDVDSPDDLPEGWRPVVRDGGTG